MTFATTAGNSSILTQVPKDSKYHLKVTHFFAELPGKPELDVLTSQFTYL